MSFCILNREIFFWFPGICFKFVYLIKIFSRNRCRDFFNWSKVPSNVILPPFIPAPSPTSIIWSASRITKSSCQQQSQCCLPASTDAKFGLSFCDLWDEVLLLVHRECTPSQSNQSQALWLILIFEILHPIMYQDFYLMRDSQININQVLGGFNNSVG